MIPYATLGTNDLTKASSFYDDVLKPLGAGRVMEFGDHGIAWGNAENAPMLAIMKPNDGKTASVGNGVMIALTADSEDTVKAVYEKALTLGGADEGAPGSRAPTFYGAYFRDLDGNKLCVCKLG